jgi:uncharacterized oxidoreductase
VLDFGTSVVAEGKVRVHHLDGNRPVPEGWLLDARGRPTTDPSVLYKAPPGSILPMGGAQSYKGFGLALMLDLLAGGLTGGRTSYPGAPPAKGNNVVFLVIDPAAFRGGALLPSEATALSRYVKGCPRAEGCTEIRLPGDPERAALQTRLAEGIPLPDGHWNRLVAVASLLNVPPPAL